MRAETHAPATQPARRHRTWAQALLLLWASSVLAQDPAPGSTAQNPEPPPFIPSESIEAGSAVAFPVDI